MTNSKIPDSFDSLSEKQKSAVNFTAEGDLLIKGMPGCGKTTVIVRRALKFIQEYQQKYGSSSDKILIVAFNKALIAYVQKLITADKDFSQELKSAIDVRTFYSLAFRGLKKVGIRLDLVTEGEKMQLIRNAISECQSINPNHRLLEKNEEFWSDEISWMKGWMAIDREAYKKVPRKGRGTGVRITSEDRDLIFDVFEAYENGLSKKGKNDWDDAALDFYRNRSKINLHMQYEHILVDEAQDFPPAWLIVTKALAKNSLTIAADAAQKIYKVGSSFKDCGIKVTGQRSKLLEETYRCTKSIIRLAKSVRDKCTTLDADGELVDLPLPAAEGSKPALVWRQEEDHCLEAMTDYIEKLGQQRDFSASNLAIVTLRNKDVSKVSSALKRSNLPAKAVKREELLDSGRFIPVTTFYQVKGLEFDHIMIWGLTDSIVPGAALYYKDDDQEDDEVLDYQRRLLYVAITRAREGVWLFSYGQQSRFIDDVEEDLYNKY